MSTLKNILTALTRRERAACAAFALLALASSVALFFVALGRYTKVIPSRGGEYVEGIIGQPKAVNPLFAVDDPDTALVRLLFANLSTLAEKIESDKTGRVWNVRFKEHLAWSDGAKLTSDDAIFTVERMQDPESQSPYFSSWQGISARRVSELEVQFVLVAPYPSFEERLRRLSVVPKHIFAETPVTNWRLSDYMVAPVGSGPFMFKGYDKKSNGFITHYHISANPHATDRVPYLDAITFRFFPNAEELVNAINTGSVDGYGTFDAAFLRGITRPYDLTEFPLPSYYAVFFNQSQNFALKDAAVRTALGGATPREAILAQVLEGRGEAAYDPIFPRHASLEQAPDLASFQKSLDAAGWIPSADGVREKKLPASKGGKDATIRLEFTLTVPQIPFLTHTAEILRAAWRAVGAEVILRIASPEDVAGAIIRGRDYQALLFGNIVNPPSDLYPFWHSQSRFYPGLNLSLYANKRADTEIDAARRTADATERAKNLASLRGVIRSDVPAVFLFSPHYLVLTRRDMKGITPRLLSEPSDRFLDAPSWYVNTTRAFQ